MAELVDAQGLGPCFLWKVGVQVPSPAPTSSPLFLGKCLENGLDVDYRRTGKVMQVTETKNEGLIREYKVVVPAADIEARLTDRLGEIARTARMPGFRPGKVPVNLLRKTHGNAVMGEVLEQTVNESSQSTISDKELRPVAQPKIEIDNFEDGEDLEYTIEVEVFPEITITDFSSIKLERLKVRADEEKVDAAIQQIAKSQ